MADLALGAVHSLLGLIRDEALLLGGVQGDVQFIKDEMESMNSFLLHLAKTTPPGGEHNDQVRTWMKQVRDLAYGCSNCIDLYVQRCDPEARHRATRGLRGYVWWLPWFFRAVFAQHRAATQLRELKIRARDVGQRQLRYGVEVPKGQDGDGDARLVAASLAGGGGVRERVRLVQDPYLRRALSFTEPDILEDCTNIVLKWLAAADTEGEGQAWPRVIAVVAPDKEDGHDVVEQVSHRLCSLQPSLQFDYQVRWLRLPEYFPIATSWHLLYSMLGELQHPHQPISRGEAAAWGQMDEHQLAIMIERHLQVKSKKSLIILERLNDGHVWEGFKTTMAAFGCAAGSVVIVTTNYKRVATGVMSVGEEPVIYSRVHFYKQALQVLKRPYDYATGHQEETALRTVLTDIFKKCEANETCMKLFFHSLCADPDWSKQDLQRLCGNLALSQNDPETNSIQMLSFCYNNLPKDFKNCLLYLAIFPQGQEVRRSSLIGRWVSEGLIIKEDWSSSVDQAERCFDALVERWFVCPVNLGVTGKVKSCKMQHQIIHRFVSEVAQRESLIDRRRLSHHLAWHFSIHSGLLLRRSDNIVGFLRTLHSSSQVKLLKVLDLEGCKDLEKNMEKYMKSKHQYLKTIFSNMLLLKYLGLRETGITHLPKGINKLQQLEVLDIRQTKVPACVTKHIILPKLKRLLAGGRFDYATVSSASEKSFTAVSMPLMIEKMPYMEVLSHVHFSCSRKSDAMLQKIGQLWLLRKLGVAIYNKETHIRNLLGAIGDLSECLQSLSIRVKLLHQRRHNTTPNTDTPAQIISNSSNMDIPAPINNVCNNSPKLLESIRISGAAGPELLFPLMSVCHQVSKVTLSNTLLNQNNVETYFAALLPNLRCLKLQCKAYIESRLTFKADEFQSLEYLFVEGSEITGITFHVGAAPKLEKIIWFFTSMESLSGIGNLPMLKELQFNTANLLDQVREAIAVHPNHPVLNYD